MKIQIDTEQNKYRQSWLEVGKMDGGQWKVADFKYPQHSKKLTVSRTYDRWAGGDGAFVTTRWTIEIPEDYKLQIAKITRTGDGKEVEVL